LEDVVSVYEAVLRALVIRELGNRAKEAADVQDILKRRVGNKLQSVPLSQTIIGELLGLNLFESFQQKDIDCLRQTFEKRHPITHNLGVVDRKYLERLRTAEREGREIFVTPEEVTSAIAFVMKIVTELHCRLFNSASE